VPPKTVNSAYFPRILCQGFANIHVRIGIIAQMIVVYRYGLEFAVVIENIGNVSLCRDEKSKRIGNLTNGTSNDAKQFALNV
jgi:hypothetical protein